MVTTDLLGPERLRHPAVRLADDRQVVPILLQRLELALSLKLEVPAHLRRSEQALRVPPVVAARTPVRFLDADQARELISRRITPGAAGGYHRI